MKVHIWTMVYCNSAVFRAGMQSFQQTVKTLPVESKHVFLDQRYPLNAPDMGSWVWEQQAPPCSTVYMASECNLGLHGGLNKLLEYSTEDLEDEDIIIAYDADEGPLQEGWLDAMLRVFAADSTCGWLSLTASAIDEQLDAMRTPTTVVGGEKVRIPVDCLMNVVCGWRVGALRASGGVFTEPYAYYGGLEIDMQPKFRKAGYWVGWLVDYKTQPHHVLSDETYRQYKLAHVGFEQPTFSGSFEEWLALYGEKGRAPTSQR